MHRFLSLKRTWFACSLAGTLAGLLAACSYLNGSATKPAASLAATRAATNALQQVKTKYAPDSHLAIFNVGVEPRGRELVLTGEVDRAEARMEAVQAVEQTGAKVENAIRLLPMEKLGDKVWGISCLSVACGREQPEHKAEMGTQILMGDIVRLWKRSTNAHFTWYYAQSADGYLSWLEKGTFVRCTREEAEAWKNSPLLIVTAFEDCIREQPNAGAQPVSDVVTGNLLRNTGEQGDWFKVELPDKRTGFLPKSAAQDYLAWKQSRQPTPANIERTARTLLGRPYLWGANSPKGLDCSGFTKLVFALNGIALKRNASHQSSEGIEVPLDADLSRLKKGDLLFFGNRSRRGNPERITHVGIYLGGKLFIHSSERVQLNSLDPSSPIRDEFRIRTLLKARRLLKES